MPTSADRQPRDMILNDAQSALLTDLSRRYRGPLLSFFKKRVRRAADIEDLTQEVFVRLATQSNLEAVEQIEGYLFQAAANLLKNRARWQTVRKGEVAEEAAAEKHEEITPERVLLGSERLERVVKALHELPERTQEVFVLHRFEGLRYGEVACQLGISMSAVEKHMMKAIAHITRRMDRE